MKKTQFFSIFCTLIFISMLCSPYPFAQDYRQLDIPKGAIARLGKGMINDMQYSPDGMRLAVATTIGIWLYDAITYKEINLLTKHKGSVDRIAFSADGGILASADERGVIHLWNTDTGEHRLKIVGDRLHFYGLAFSPNGNTLASGDQNGIVHLWDIFTGEEKHNFPAHAGRVIPN